MAKFNSIIDIAGNRISNLEYSTNENIQIKDIETKGKV